MKNDKDLPIRQLIRFSNYSLCITLPKDHIDNLGWQQGDRIEFLLDQNNQGLLLTRQEAKQEIKTEPLNTNHEETQLFEKDDTKKIIKAEKPTKNEIEETAEEPKIKEESGLLDNLEPIPQLN